jgi:hypothetical protein
LPSSAVGSLVVVVSGRDSGVVDEVVVTSGAPPVVVEQAVATSATTATPMAMAPTSRRWWPSRRRWGRGMVERGP